MPEELDDPIEHIREEIHEAAHQPKKTGLNGQRCSQRFLPSLRLYQDYNRHITPMMLWSNKLKRLTNGAIIRPREQKHS
jgi:hypothetical protein